MQPSDQTIAAISSPLGWAPRGIVRLSGDQAIALAEALFVQPDGRSLRRLPGHTRLLGELRLEPPGPTVPAELLLFRAPRSYTGQDLVELHTVGSPVVLSMLLEALLSRGARLAEPGEFTARAFLAGKLDLTQAEGVAATVASRSDAQLHAARRLLQGRLSDRTRQIQHRLTDLLALVEADIDFSDEPIEFLSPADAARRIAQIRRQIDELIGSAVAAERIETLPQVMLVGPTNVGKSTLLNRLTGLDRAICSPLPGTTRDVLTAPLNLPGGQVMLLDAAGLVGPRPTTGIDQLADAAARHAADHADLLIFVVDLAGQPVAAQLALLESLPSRPRLIAGNKIDLLSPPSQSHLAEMIASRSGQHPLLVSAITGQGCDELLRQIGLLLHDQLPDRSAHSVVLNARHRRALQEARAALARAATLVRAAPDIRHRAELLALELREASHHLGTIVGQVVTDDLLDRIFANFCIGK